MTWDILGLGAVAIDDLVFVPHFPEAGSKMLVEREERSGGGLTGTALIAAARQEVRTAYMGVLGTDELSRYTLRELEREGVDCSPVLVRNGAGPVHSIIIVVSSSGQRTILHSHARLQERPPDQPGSDMIACSRHCSSIILPGRLPCAPARWRTSWVCRPSPIWKARSLRRHSSWRSLLTT